MKDLEIHLKNEPGTLAKMGEVLGKAGISILGGGVFGVKDKGIAHFLFEDTASAKKVLEENDFEMTKENEILVQRLNQGQPGQLGKITRLMADAGINIEVMYSDHENQLILVVDNLEKGKIISERWKKGELK